MTADHDVESRGGGVNIQLIEAVENVDAGGTGIDNSSCGQTGGPGVEVDVAAHRGHGRETAKGLEDLWFADVACVDDEIGAAQGFHGFGAKKSVGV